MKLVLALCLSIVAAGLALLLLRWDSRQPTTSRDRAAPERVQPEHAEIAEVSTPAERSERSRATTPAESAAPRAVADVDSIPRDAVEVLVVDTTSGKPVSGAEVIWANLAEMELPPIDTQPRWTLDLTAMPPSARRATTDASGTAHIDARVFPGRILAQRGERLGSLFVDATQPRPLRVEIAPDLGLVLQVVDANDRLIAGVPVCLRDVPNLRTMGSLWKGTTSGERGSVSVPRLQFSRRPEFGRGLAYAMFDFPTRELVFVPVDLEHPQSNPVRLVLPPCGSVVIAVRESNGKPATADSLFLGLADDVGEDGNIRWGVRTFDAERFENGDAHYPFVGIGLDLQAAAQRGLVYVRAAGFGPRTQGECVRFDLDLGEPQPTLTGRLVLESGEPLRDRRTRAALEFHSSRGTGSGTKSIRTDAEGFFHLALVGIVGQSYSASLTLEPEGIGPGEGGRAPLRIETDALPCAYDLGDVFVQVPRVVGAGVVIDDVGRPILRALLSLAHSSHHVDGGAWRSHPGLQSRVQSDGSFTVLAVGDVDRVRVTALRDGYANGGSVEFEPVRRDLRIVLPRACEIRGSALIDPDIGTGRIRVFAFDHGVRPAKPEFASERETYVDLEGNFGFKRLPPGRFDVEFRIGRTGEALVTVEDVDVPPGGKATDPRLDAVNLLGRVRAETPR